MRSISISRQGKYPSSLDALVSEQYLRKIPEDRSPGLLTLADRAGRTDPGNPSRAGIYDVKAAPPARRSTAPRSRLVTTPLAACSQISERDSQLQLPTPNPTPNFQLPTSAPGYGSRTTHPACGCTTTQRHDGTMLF